MMTIKTKGEKRYVHALLQNVADIPGGVTIHVADLIPGKILYEGTVIGLDSAGIAHVLKSAKVHEQANANAKTIKVEKGSHLKANDYITDGNAAVKIVSVDSASSAEYDTITVELNSSAGLKQLEKDDVIEQAETAATSGAALAYEPLAMLADSYDVKADDNLWAPAVVIGTFKKCVIPPVSSAVVAKLKGIVLL